MNISATVGTTAKALVIPSSSCRRVLLQNLGAANIRLTIDGGASVPTTSTGTRLPPGADLEIGLCPGQTKIPAIWGIAESGTVAFNADTDDAASSGTSGDITINNLTDRNFIVDTYTVKPGQNVVPDYVGNKLIADWPGQVVLVP